MRTPLSLSALLWLTVLPACGGGEEPQEPSTQTPEGPQTEQPQTEPQTEPEPAWSTAMVIEHRARKAEFAPGASVPLQASITAAQGPVASLEVVYHGVDGQRQRLPMTQAADGVWHAELEGLQEPAFIRYHLAATDQEGRMSRSPAPPAEPGAEAATHSFYFGRELVSAIEPEDYVREVHEALRHAGTREDPIPVTTDLLGGWQFDETLEDPFPPHVHAIQGKVVDVKGFMLPDVDFENITKFHLVRSLWGCCFGAPPRVNELIRIHTPGGEGLDYTYNTLEILGTFEAKFEMIDGLIEDLYRLRATSIIEGDFDDPLAPQGATAADLQGAGFGPAEMEF